MGLGRVVVDDFLEVSIGNGGVTGGNGGIGGILEAEGEGGDSAICFSFAISFAMYNVLVEMTEGASLLRSGGCSQVCPQSLR